MNLLELESVQLSDRKNENVESFIEQTANLESVTAMLQKFSVFLSSARALLNSAIQKFPEFQIRFIPIDAIVKNLVLKAAVSKVQNRSKLELTLRGKRCIAHLLESDCGSAGAFSISRFTSLA